MPTYDDNDKAALTALLIRFDRMWQERLRDQKLKEAVDARLGKYPALIEQLRSAFALFGVEGLAKENWEKLRADMGDALVTAAISQVQKYPPIPNLPGYGYESGAESDKAAEDDFTLFLPDAGEQQVPKGEKPMGETVREIVLEKLKEAGTEGTKAAELRKVIETARGTQLHEKTVGMTLYRLSQEGVARREGRTWFFVPPLEDETKNPGAVTPGLINQDDKEGEEL
jgi:hypothetical protein